MSRSQLRSKGTVGPVVNVPNRLSRPWRSRDRVIAVRARRLQCIAVAMVSVVARFASAQSRVVTRVPDIIGATDIAASTNQSGAEWGCATFGNGDWRCFEWSRISSTVRTLATLPGSSLRPSADHRFTRIQPSDQHGCGIETSGRVRCWGTGYAGATGVGDIQDVNTSTHPRRLEHIVSLAIDFRANLSIDASGAVWFWGEDTYSLIAGGNQFVPLRIRAITDAVDGALSAGGACVARREGSVWCWGSNADGQLGDGTTVGRAIPAAISGLSGVVAVSGGELGTMCVRTSEGHVFCWGGTAHTGTHAEQVRLPVNAVQVDVGVRTACAVGSDGRAYCWPAGSIPTTPVTPYGALSDVRRVAIGDHTIFLLRADGSVWQ